MAKNITFMQSSSPPHRSYTIVAPDDDEDTDICPVCDGLCTCHNNNNNDAARLQLNPLKIKLTVPKSLRAKPLPLFKNNAQTTSGFANDGYPSVPRKRGRPPKNFARVSSAPTSTHHNSKSSHKRTKTTKTKLKQSIKARAALAKRFARSKTIQQDESSSSSVSDETTTARMDMDVGSHYPTFVSASALDSLESSAPSSSDSDSDDGRLTIEKVKDKEREKARMKRELFGGGGGEEDEPWRKRVGNHHHDWGFADGNPNYTGNNQWVIRSRKKSVGLSEDEGEGMHVDSETSEGSDEDGEEDGERLVDAGGEDDLDLHKLHGGHFPLGTSWSEDEEQGEDDDDDESSFDADLFFRHLYDSSSSSSSSSGCDSGDEDSEDSDATRTEESVAMMGPLQLHHTHAQAAVALPFEVAESWDGGVVFTNGLKDLDGVMGIDWSFEVEAERVGRRRWKKEKGKGRKRKGGKGGKRRELIGHSGDVDMISSDGYLEEDGEFGFECEDEVGFLGFFEASAETTSDFDAEGTAGEETQGEGGGSGDTTDEDLVGEDMLPNEKAMRIFRFPCIDAHGGSGRMWAVGVGSGSVDPVSLFGRREMIGDGGRREVLGPLDILNGRAGAGVWDWERGKREYKEGDEDCGVGSSDEVSDGKLRGRGRRRRKAKEKEKSPTSPVPSTPADSISISISTSATSVGSSEPRKGVFVVSALSCPPLLEFGSEMGKAKGDGHGRAVIGEDRKGADVPSPHPQRRRRGRRGADGSVEVIEQLLRRHISDSFSAGSTQVGVAHTTDAAPSSPSILTSPSPFSGARMEDEFDGMGVRADRHSQGKQERDVFELDDVLEASFLNDEDEDDEEMRCAGVQVKLEGDSDVATPSDAHMLTSPLLSDIKATRSVVGGDVRGDPSVEAEAGVGHDCHLDIDLDRDAAADAAAAKNLSRWDVISIGAFRQTQEAQREGGVVGVGERAGHGHGHGHTPRSSVDLGKAMKSSPMSMLWRRTGASGTSGGRQRVTLPGSIRKSMSGGSNGSGGGGNASASGSNGKHAKRRRLMMSAPTMSSPLVLGSGNASASAGSSQPSPNSSTNNNNNTNTNNSKNRKEARRERKLLKRKHHGLAPPSGASSSHSHPHPHPHSTHHHHPPHQYHQHQHHPNAKARGVSSMQRLGSFGSGVSPLNP